MSNQQPQSSEETAVDDVRKVREAIAREHGNDLRKHAEETRRIAAELRAKLNVKLVPAPSLDTQRVGTSA